MAVFGLVLAAVFVAACVLFVARPFLAARAAGTRSEPAVESRERLLEERDRALAALKELEFDHRTGKISDDDYRALVGPLRREAVAALQALEPRAAEADAPVGNRAETHA